MKIDLLTFTVFFAFILFFFISKDNICSTGKVIFADYEPLQINARSREECMNQCLSLPLDGGTSNSNGEPEFGLGSRMELTSFLRVLDFTDLENRSQKKKRNKVFNQWDRNGSDFLSLNEVDAGMQNLLQSEIGRDEGTRVWRNFRPSYIRAFNNAIGVGWDDNKKHYITRKKFRVLLTYLRLYGIMYEVFSYIDGGGVGITRDDDRRISHEEWTNSIPILRSIGLSWAPFVRLKNASVDDFKKIDRDGHGMVLLREFCTWIKEGEIRAKTSIGNELSKSHK